MTNVKVANSVPSDVKSVINDLISAGVTGNPTIPIGTSGETAVLYRLKLSNEFVDDAGNPKIVQVVGRSGGGDPEVAVSKAKLISKLQALMPRAAHDADDEDDSYDSDYDDDNDYEDSDGDATDDDDNGADAVLDLNDAIMQMIGRLDASGAGSGVSPATAKNLVNAARRFFDRVDD